MVKKDLEFYKGQNGMYQIVYIRTKTTKQVFFNDDELFNNE
jgi:hypothetical protein